MSNPFSDTETVWGVPGPPGDGSVTSGQIGSITSRLTALEEAGAITTYAALTDVDTTDLADGMLAVWDATGEEWVVANPWEVIGGFDVTIQLGDGTNVITNTEPAVTFSVPVGWELAGYEAEGDTSGSITLDTARAAAGSTSYTSIDGSAPINLSAQQVRVDTTLTGWTKTGSAHDKIKTTVTGTPSSITSLTVIYRFARTGV